MWDPYTDEHRAFRQTVRQFAEKEVAPFATEWEEACEFPREIFTRSAELGLHGAHYPEEHGGAGGDYWFSVAKAEELPRCQTSGVSLSLLVQGDMATPVISEIGTQEQIDEFLRPALRGEKIAAIGVSEPDAGSDVAAIRTVAKKDGGDYLISGQKTFITNGSRADFITMLVKTDPDAGAHGCSFVLVPTNLPGFQVARKLKKLGHHASDTAELFLDEVRVPQRYRLGDEGMGFMYLMQNFQSERLIGAVNAVAACEIVIEQSRQYGETRRVFGKPLIKRELWQHRFVDLITKTEMCKAFVYKVVDAFNTERYVNKSAISMETVKGISMAKVAAGDLVTEVMDTCLQFHGGWGYVEELPIARAYRDSRLIRIGGGSTETMRYYLAKLMGL
ncbi:MAG: acyl-CoA dehydrogenase family protein [Polyangiaceae bacterium]|nr:acyl-CoA dehydrogenase family protein [Polyangiaceae bacterium]MCW5789913.1 acyl-CoA dehydrogenase family protein [Polyangiaceae bacterium]